jgi:hypothetical protein
MPKLGNGVALRVMRRRGRFAVTLVVAFALTAAGCARNAGQGSGQPPPVSPSPSSGLSTPAPTDKEHLQARDLLDRWRAAATAAGGPPWFYVAPDYESVPTGEWESADFGENAKIAWYAGAFVAATTLSDATPPLGDVRWADGVTRSVPLMSANDALEALKADGNGQCGGCQPLVVTGATLSTAEVTTSRGPATTPVWEFTLQGTAVRITRVAVAPSATASLTPEQGSGMRIESATGTPSGRELTVTITGSPGPASQPCGADYDGEAVESDLGVVVLVHEHRYVPTPSDLSIACTAVGAIRKVTVQLASPLGDRAVLDPQGGIAVPVTFSN